MGSIVAIILIYVVFSLGDRYTLHVKGYVPQASRVAKVILILALIGAVLKACGIVL